MSLRYWRARMRLGGYFHRAGVRYGLPRLCSIAESLHGGWVHPMTRAK